MRPDLTDEEIDAICAGLKQNAAKVRFLQRLGLKVERRPNGHPLVNRAHYNAVTGVASPDETGGAWSPKWTVPL
ncbi:MAG: DUF4224 domain-containing protein [Methylibium sp.]|uniref:DUF4224 domain-containing protein n=1 Tax=Methylibium sp. TaxID=2067992 RepID=UPI0017C9BDDC|nr:DUF4224 domain-containing protein [Methylibium sp.]MBA3599091.1 DUF4224 domain-containing protein [Methylibium sp.]